MARLSRPLYKRNQDYVAVRRVRLGADCFIEPGEDLIGFKQYHLRSLYTRHRIGVKGHPWTEAMLKTTGTPKQSIKVDETDPWAGMEPVKDGSKWVIDGVSFTSKKKAKAWMVENLPLTPAQIAIEASWDEAHADAEAYEIAIDELWADAQAENDALDAASEPKTEEPASEAPDDFLDG